MGRIKISALCAVTLVALLSTPAAASSSINGYVLGFQALPAGGNIVFVFASGTGRTLPGCANAGFPTRWALDISTDRGKVIMSVLMTAQALQQTVKINGTNSCTPGWSGGDIENIDNVITNNVV